MIRTLAVAAAVSALAIPASAMADPAFDAFQSICWNSGGDYVAAVKAADAGGWSTTDVVADPEPGLSVTDKAAREKSVGGMNLTVLISRGLRHISSGDIKEMTCKLSTSKPDEGVVSQGQSWIGAPPDGGDATFAVYYVKLAGGAPNHVGKDGANAAMAAGGFGVLKFQQNSNSSIMVYQGYAK